MMSAGVADPKFFFSDLDLTCQFITDSDKDPTYEVLANPGPLRNRQVQLSKGKPIMHIHGHHVFQFGKKRDFQVFFLFLLSAIANDTYGLVNNICDILK